MISVSAIPTTNDFYIYHLPFWQPLMAFPLTHVHAQQGDQQTQQQPTPIPYSAAYHARLAALVHDPHMLKVEGYKMESFGDEEILRFERCRDCHGISFLSFSFTP